MKVYGKPLPECGNSSFVENSSDIKLPLHVQCNLPVARFDHHGKSETTITAVTDSDSSTTCTNPRLRKMLDLYFPSSDSWEETDVEYDSSPGSGHQQRNDRQRRNIASHDTDKFNHFDNPNDVGTPWPLYPLQCPVRSHDSIPALDIPNHTLSSEFTEIRKKHSVREERCRQALNKISSSRKGNQLKSSSDSPLNERLDENISVSHNGESSCRSELLADIKLTVRAKKIQHNLNIHELEELALEAERAAEAGDEKFFGSATKFGIEEAVASSMRCQQNEEVMGDFTTPNKSNCSHHHDPNSGSNNHDRQIVTPGHSTSNSESSDELANEISPPPQLKRFPKTAIKKPSPLSFSERTVSAPTKLHILPNHDITPTHISNTLNMTASFLTPLQFNTVAPPPEKIRVMSLRQVDEVIPSFMEVHLNLRLNLVRNGVGSDSLFYNSDDNDIDRFINSSVNKEDVSLPQGRSFSFSNQKLLSFDRSLGTREGDHVDSLDNTLDCNESSGMSDQIRDDILDCGSFVSCVSANLDNISQQVLMTPKKAIQNGTAIDAKSNEVTSIYISTLASEIHVPGTEIEWTSQPSPHIPYLEECYETKHCLTTPQRPQSARLYSKSRWSSFWENLSPKRKLFAPSPIRFPGIMSSRTLGCTSLSEFEGMDLDWDPWQPEVESLQQELKSLPNINVETQDTHGHKTEKDIASLDSKENIVPSITSAGVIEIIDNKTEPPDSIITIDNTCDFKRAKQSFIKKTDITATISTSSQYEQAKQSFNGIQQNEGNTDVYKQKLSFEDGGAGMGKYDYLSEHAFSCENATHILSLLTSSDSINSINPSENGANTTTTSASPIVADNSVKNSMCERDSTHSTEVEAFVRQPVMNISHNTSNFPLQQTTVPCKHVIPPGVNFTSQQFVETAPNKPPLYPAGTQLDNILKRVNQRLSADKANFSQQAPLIYQQVVTEPSPTHNNEIVAEDCISVEASDSRITMPGDIDAILDTVSSECENQGLPILHRKQSSSLPSIICLGDESSFCGIGDGGARGICDGKAEYSLDSRCNEKSTLVGLIEKVPSIIGRLSPLLGRKLPNSEDGNIPEDLSFVKNYFYISVDPKDNNMLSCKSEDSNHILQGDNLCESYKCGLACNMNAALEWSPEHDLARSNISTNKYPENPSQGLRFSKTHKGWSDEPLFQRGRVVIDERTFDSPSLQLKKVEDFDSEGNPCVRYDKCGVGHFDSDTIAQFESTSQCTFAEDNIEIEHCNFPSSVDVSESRSVFRPIKENCDDCCHFSSNNIEDKQSNNMKLEGIVCPSQPKSI